MSFDFHVISDSKYDFLDVPLRNIILKAGRKNVVFVEGYDDKIIFEILYENHLDQIHFIHAGIEEAKGTSNLNTVFTGGCEAVKDLLKTFVTRLRNEKRFYGVIDRDLKFDEDIQFEKNLPEYDGRLFIFFERYTLENYFIEPDILCKFLHGISLNHKKLSSFLSDEERFKEEITETVNTILKCLMEIGAANLTIRHFDTSVEFLERSIEFIDIEHRLYNRLNRFFKSDVKTKFDEFKDFIEKNNGVQKFASGKTYFSTQFNKCLEKKCNVNIQLNNYKSVLARIMKEFEHPEFKELLDFLLQNK